MRQINAWQILDVLVLGVDDLRQLLSIHHLLKHPHGHIPLKFVRLLQGIVANDLGDGRAPAKI